MATSAATLERPKAQTDKKTDGKAKAQRGATKGKTGSAGTSRTKRGQANQALGKKGEDAAARFLVHRGYDILERNWTCFAGEADIIALDQDWLVFVEVKTRRNTDKGFPSEAVSARKREKYERIALAYASSHDYSDIPVRFDVVSIVVISPNKAMIRHTIGAFTR